MPSFAVTDQLSLCRYVSISAQKTAPTNPTFSLHCDGEEIVSASFTNGSLNLVQEYQLFCPGNTPAIGTVFQVHATGAIIKNVNFPLERLSDYTRKVLFHGVKVGYIGDPNYSFAVDGVALSSTTPSTLVASNTPRSAVLYFPAMTTGFLAHIKRTADSGGTFGVNDNLTSIQFLSQPVDE